MSSLTEEGQVAALLAAKAEWFRHAAACVAGAELVTPMLLRLPVSAAQRRPLDTAIAALAGRIRAIYDAPTRAGADLTDHVAWMADSALCLAFLSGNAVIRPRPFFEAALAEVNGAWHSLLVQVLAGVQVDAVQAMANLRLAGSAQGRHGTGAGDAFSDWAIHAESWAGEPLDSVAVYMPCQDGEAARFATFFDTQPEYFPLHLRRGSSYQDTATRLRGLGASFVQLPLELEAGYLYLADCLMPRRVQRGEGLPMLGLDSRLRTGVIRQAPGPMDLLGLESFRLNYQPVPPHVFQGVHWR